MNKELLLFAGSAIAAPAVLAAANVPLPDGMPAWTPWAIALFGPVLIFLSKVAMKALAAGLRAKAKKLKNDSEPSNDELGEVLDSVAGSLEAAADKKKE